MPKLTRKDWDKLRNFYKVAFAQWDDEHYNQLMNNLVHSDDPEVDVTDALLISLAKAEPRIPPAQ